MNIDMRIIRLRSVREKSDRASPVLVLLLLAMCTVFAVSLIYSPAKTVPYFGGGVQQTPVLPPFVKPPAANEENNGTLNVPEKESDIAVSPEFFMPLDGKITSYFAQRDNPFGGGGGEYHLGIDISAADSTEILAYSDGTVEAASYDRSYGNYLMIRHSDSICTLYAHCSEIYASVGEYVSGGELIAKAGSTGRSTGPHLHFEYRVSGIPVDPLTAVSCFYEEKSG